MILIFIMDLRPRGVDVVGPIQPRYWAGAGARINYINTFNYIHRYIKVASRSVRFASFRSGSSRIAPVGIKVLWRWWWWWWRWWWRWWWWRCPPCPHVLLSEWTCDRLWSRYLILWDISLKASMTNYLTKLQSCDWHSVVGRQRISQMSSIASSRTPICRG